MNKNDTKYNAPLILTIVMGLIALVVAQFAHASIGPSVAEDMYDGLGVGVSTFIASSEHKDGTFNKYIETCKSEVEVLNQCVVEAAVAIGVVDSLYKSQEVDMPTIRMCMNQYVFDNGMPDLAQAIKAGCFDFRAGELFFQEMIKVRDGLK